MPVASDAFPKAHKGWGWVRRNVACAEVCNGTIALASWRNGRMVARSTAWDLKFLDFWGKEAVDGSGCL